MGTLVTRAGLRVDEGALTWVATRSGGPGGQHADTSDTAVTLRLSTADAGWPASLRARVTATLGDVVTVTSADTRSQWRNRQLAWDRLAARLDAAARPARQRRRTVPTRGAVEKRLEQKRRRAATKRARHRPDTSSD